MHLGGRQGESRCEDLQARIHNVRIVFSAATRPYLGERGDLLEPAIDGDTSKKVHVRKLLGA